MTTEYTESKSFALLSWAALGGSMLTALFLLTAIAWTWNQVTLTTEMPIPEYQGLSLQSCYFRILCAGFLNVTWIVALFGVVFLWLVAKRRGRAFRRLALAVSLTFVHQWLLATLVFLFQFSNWKT
jgi:hypothetical protein